MKQLVIFAITFVCLSALGQQAQQNGTTIFWDNSLSAENRNLEKDFSVLQRIFEKLPNQKVQLVFFNLGLQEHSLTIQGGDWSALKEMLQTVYYDGATHYGQLGGKALYETVYLFADGRSSFENDNIPLKKGNFLVNSNPDRDDQFLKRTALLTRSRLVDFAAVLPQNIGQLKSKKTEAGKPVRGIVYIDNKPAPDVKVAIKGVVEHVITDEEGRFSINALPTDSLIVSSRSKRTYKVLGVTRDTEMNVFLEAEVVPLEEVVLMEKAPEPVELVNTGNVKVNKEKLGYALQSIDEENISEITTDVSNAMQGKVSGVQLGQNDDLSQVTMRPSNSILGNSYGLIVLDGVPLRRASSAAVGATSPNSSGLSNNIRQNGGAPGASQDLSFIDPQNIADITILKGLAATNRFGSEGVNGVILITTKTAKGGEAQGESTDLARLKDNIYNAEEAGVSSSNSPVINALSETSGIEEAYEKYISLRVFNGADPNFYLDSFSYFRDKDQLIASRIISNLLELSTKDRNVLRTTAVSLQAIGANKEAMLCYESLIKLEPKEMQAYLGRAILYREMGQYQDAYNELSGLLKGTKYPQLNTQPISKTLNREIRNLIYHHRNKLNLANAAPEWSNNSKFSVRAVFEWDSPGGQFELQFVNPQNRFFNWSHTNSENNARIREELDLGYRVEEFEFYGEVQGKWIINASIPEVEIADQRPLVLKCTLYQNFGEANQQKEELWVHFKGQQEKKILKTLLIN